eukprot:465924-Pleurochrysis_carterae.AAC.1
MSFSSMRISRLVERKANRSTLNCGLATIRPHLNLKKAFMGVMRTLMYVDGMLNLAQARDAKEMRRAVHHFGEHRSRVNTAEADISDLSLYHQVEHDRPSKRQPPTARVIATVNSRERIKR